MMNDFQPYAGQLIAPLPQSDFTRLLVLLGMAGVVAAVWITTPEPQARTVSAAVQPAAVDHASVARITLPLVVVVGRREAPAAARSMASAEDCLNARRAPVRTAQLEWPTNC